jgi:hypothetical protein
MPKYDIWGKTKGTQWKYGSILTTIPAVSAESALRLARVSSKSRGSSIYGFTVTRAKRSIFKK